MSSPSTVWHSTVWHSTVSRSASTLALLAVLAVSLGACGGDGGGPATPDLAPRGTQLTTIRPARQDLSNKVSLAGKVEMNPVYGLVAPVDGVVHYYDLTSSQATPTRPTPAANVWAGNKATRVDVPAGSTFAGRLVDDRSRVTAGMPIVSARYAGYGIVAEIEAAQAYQITDGLATVRAQIQNGPGPFDCTVLGTIAALPAGTIPPPPPPDPASPPDQAGTGAQAGGTGAGGSDVSGAPGGGGSAATGMRLVCTAPADVKLINGAGATLEVVTATVTNVLVLPVEAVAGSHGKGQVTVVKPDGTTQTVEVELGLTDGKVIEIRSGLTGEETVAVPGPNLLPAQGGDQNNPGGPVVIRK